MNRTFLYAAHIALIVAFTACSDSSPNNPGSDGSVTQRDATTESTIPPDKELSFTNQTLDMAHAGQFTRIASHSDTIGIAYLRDIPDEDLDLVTCPPPAMGDPNPEPQTIDPTQEVYYVEFDGSNWGDPHRVQRTYGPPQGLSLIFDSSGNPAIGFLGGSDDDGGLSVQECYSSDAKLARSSNNGQSWNETTVDPGGSNSGDTAGYWMSIAEDCDGNIQAAYRDMHFGEYEADNPRDWRYAGTSITDGSDDGMYNTLLFTPDCHPAVLSYNPERTGAAGGLRLAVNYGSFWDIKQVATGATQYIPDFKRHNDLYAFVYYEPSDASLYYKESTDLETWTQPALVDYTTTRHGIYASLAFDSNGYPAVSYYRCANAGSSKCEPNEDGLMFSYRIDGSWKTWEVDTGKDLSCGYYTALTFDAQDHPVIAYQCTVINNVEGTYPSVLKVAKGVWQ